MCLIIANPAGNFVPTDFILNAYSTNSDGFGVMFAKNNLLRIKRGLFSISHIVDIFDELNKAKKPYVAHFRYATHGTTNGQNCHPFPISGKLGGVAMVHNGTLAGVEWRRKDKSDTAILADRIEAHIGRSDFGARDLFKTEVPEIRQRYTKAIGTDKLVFMNGKEEINIYNEGQGIWLEGVWYSNLYSLLPDNVSVGSWVRGKGWSRLKTKSGILSFGTPDANDEVEAEPLKLVAE